MAIENKETRGFSLIETYDRIGIPSDGVKTLEEALESSGKPPAVAIRMALATAWKLGDKTGVSKTRIRLHGPSGETLQERVAEMTTGEEDRGKTRRVVLRFDSFPFAGLGEYAFTVDAWSGKRWKAVAQLPLELRESD